MKMTKKGFTLIELMIVVAIIGILAAVAIPKFADLINKSKEGATKGSLGAVRSAISVYYGDQEGTYPKDDLTSLAPRYINEIPAAKVPPNHADSAAVADDNSATLSDAGGWDYDNVTSENAWGTLLVNCSHTDSKGNQWTSY